MFSMDIILVILAFVLLIIGIIGSVIPMVPGPPLSFLGLLVLKWSAYGDYSVVFIWIWAFITIAITVMDYILPSLFARQFGGSRAASIGSLLGLIVGIFLYPPWTMIFGPFVGAFLGELIHNSKDKKKALMVALGAFLSFIAGSGAKLVTTSLMLFFAIRVTFS